MKHQYVGDINDYCKYGLLRALTARGQVTSTVAWMLTLDDLSRDGRKLSYLAEPAMWRPPDPELFDALSALVAQDKRTVVAVEEMNILPQARFHSELVPRGREERRAHFARTLITAQDSELLFFDPDNGIEVASCPPGRSGSEKYLLWGELVAAYQAGHSVLVYQHFPRQPRDSYVLAVSEQICERTGAREVLAFRTAGVVFLLAPQPMATAWYTERMGEVTRRWHGVIEADLVAVA